MKLLEGIFIFSIVFLVLSTINADESNDNDITLPLLADEKAHIKAENGLPVSRPTPGQLIFMASPTAKVTTEAVAVEPEVTKPSPSSITQPRKSSKSDDSKKQIEDKPSSSEKEKEKPRKQTDLDESLDSDKKEEKPSKKSKSNPRNPKKDTSNNITTDPEDELPKRLFRPRFRAESSAETIKSSILITITLLLMAFLFVQV